MNSHWNQTTQPKKQNPIHKFIICISTTHLLHRKLSIAHSLRHMKTSSGAAISRLWRTDCFSQKVKDLQNVKNRTRTRTTRTRTRTMRTTRKFLQVLRYLSILLRSFSKNLSLSSSVTCRSLSMICCRSSNPKVRTSTSSCTILLPSAFCMRAVCRRS